MFSEALEYVINLIEANGVGLHTAAAAAASMFNVDARDLVDAVQCRA